MLAAPAAAAEPRTLLPGVTYERQATLTRHGPVVLHVLAAPRPGGLLTLGVALSDDAIQGREPLTAIERRLSPGATTAGVAGDYAAPDGRPAGLLLRGGALEHQPRGDRVSIGVDGAGTLRIERVRLFATWQGTGPRRSFTSVDAPPGANGLALYTPAWGAETPRQEGSVELVLQPFGKLPPTGQAAGPVVQRARGGGTPIPRDGAVVAARGTAAQRLLAESAAGETITIRTVTKPDWSGLVEGLGGGPLLVRDGVPVFRGFEAFPPRALAQRTARSAVGQRADGSILLVAVDGGRPGYSVGMTTLELAQALVRLGAVTAAGLEGGDAATMAFDGELLSRPSAPDGERPVSEALLLSYAGVVAAPPSEPVLSPDGDGAGDAETFAFKLVRASTVTATVVAPDGSVRTLLGPERRDPGVATLTWGGRSAEGALEPEGGWRFVVSATDDAGRTSQAERPFSLDATLGALVAAGSAPAAPRTADAPLATYRLTRPAEVRATIETPTGVVVRTLEPRQLEPGDAAVTWDGLDDAGRSARPGRYVVRVRAASAVGTSSLAAPFVLRG